MNHEMLAHTWLNTARNMYNGKDTSKGPVFRLACTMYYLGKAEAHAMSVPNTRLDSPLVTFIRACIDAVMPPISD